MPKRQQIRYVRKDTNRPISDEDIYMMTMQYQYQRMPLHKLARQFGLTVGQVRDLLGRRVGGSCCG